MQAPFPREVIPFERDGNLMRVAIVALLPSQVPPAPADFGGTSGSLRVPNAETQEAQGGAKKSSKCNTSAGRASTQAISMARQLVWAHVGRVATQSHRACTQGPRPCSHASWQERCTLERSAPEGDFYSCPL
jgi:hypothetical protein